MIAAPPLITPVQTSSSAPAGKISSADSDGTSTTTPATGVRPGETKEALITRLLEMEPKDLLNEIVSGRVPVSILDKVTERLPAEMLQEAVDYLTNSSRPGAGDLNASSQKEPVSSSDEKPESGGVKRKLDEFDPSQVKLNSACFIFAIAVPNILSVFYSARIVYSDIVYSRGQTDEWSWACLIIIVDHRS